MTESEFAYLLALRGVQACLQGSPTAGDLTEARNIIGGTLAVYGDEDKAPEPCTECGLPRYGWTTFGWIRGEGLAYRTTPHCQCVKLAAPHVTYAPGIHGIPCA